MTDPVLITRHIQVHGRVQGVGYRISAKTEAERLGLGGWVRNCKDGSVEMMVTGSQTAVEHFIRWARQGPSSAQVTQLVLLEPTTGSPVSAPACPDIPPVFEIRATL